MSDTNDRYGLRCTAACSESHTYSWPCEQSTMPPEPLRQRLRVRPILAWYDMWVGVFVDRRERKLYLFPIPCVGIVVSWRSLRAHNWAVRP